MSIIAVDFDGCLCENAWPGIGAANAPAIRYLLQRKAQGDKIILWTCRSGELLEDAVRWCMAMGLHFDAINDNLPENIEKYGNNCRKVWADEYWDDKGVQVVAMHGVSIHFGLSKQSVTIPIRRDNRLKRWWRRWRSSV